MKKIMSLVIAGMILLVGCGNASDNSSQNAQPDNSSNQQAEPANKLEKIKASGKLVVGTCADYPPYEFHMMIDGKDEVVGFDIEIAKEIGKALGVEVEIQDMGFDAVLAGVGSGLIDIGMAGINPSKDREAAMDFSEMYYQTVHTILVRADAKDNYKSVDDLAGKTIGAQIGTVQEQISKETIKGANVKSLGKVTDLVLELKTGMIEAIVLEEPVANSYAKQNPDLAVGDSIKMEKIDGGAAVITANDEKELMAEINKILAELKESGKIEQFVAEANALAEKATE
ncbi:MAG: transporter substrate-binding domain-containing protein [Peptostreptococcaceae bacterium]|nr:transporter substrate-binding domain-containing protein [Peptostreptococcaceae bacterium]